MPLKRVRDKDGDEVPLDQYLTARLNDVESCVVHVSLNMDRDAKEVLEAFDEIQKVARQAARILRKAIGQ